MSTDSNENEENNMINPLITGMSYQDVDKMLQKITWRLKNNISKNPSLAAKYPRVMDDFLKRKSSMQEVEGEH